MATNNSQNSQFANNADGYTLGGGTTSRNLTVTGGNVTLTGAGSNTYTMPSSSDTLVGRASVDTLTNKDMTSSTNSFPGTTLGYAQITSNFVTSSGAGDTQVTGLSTTVTVPSGGRRIKITTNARYIANGTTSTFPALSIWQGTVGSGTQLARSELGPSPSAGFQYPAIAMSCPVLIAGSYTFNTSVSTNGTGQTTLFANSTTPAFIIVELI